MRTRSIGIGSLFAALLLVPTTTASASTIEVLDGIPSSQGAIHARVAGDSAAIVRNGIPWVFYGGNPGYGYRLRLAKVGPTTTYRTLDGAGGLRGRTSHSVATDVSATTYGNTVHVFYRDETERLLRHAWLDGNTWSFETLDGDVSSGGRTTHDVGVSSTALVYRDRLNVFYADLTTGDVRRAVFDGSGWRYSIVDGNSSLGGRTTDIVGTSIRAGVWGSRLHLLYTASPSGVREATLGGRAATYSTISTVGVAPLALLKVSDSRVHLAYSGSDGPEEILSGRWNGSSWVVDRYVSGVERVTGLTIFLDEGTPYLAAGISQCFGSGGCDRLIGIAAWNGATFDDPYYGGAETISGDPPGNPSSAVTIDGVAHLFVGGIGYSTELDIYDHVLMHVQGPFA